MDSGNVFQKLLDLERINYATGLKTEDTYCLELLQPVLLGYPLLAFTGSALRPFCLVHIINDMIVNNRTSVLEFGAGISTILMARVIRKNNLKTRVTAVEHDQGWADSVKSLLTKEELNDYVTLIHAPLVNSTLSVDGNQWHDATLIDRAIGDSKFDLVIIDGPPAWEPGKQKARYPAVPYVFDKLSSVFSIYLDDANRAGEKSLMEMWEKEFRLKFNLLGKTLAHCSKGKLRFTNPFAYYS